MSEPGAARPAGFDRARDIRRVRAAHVEWVSDRLSDRDWQIIEAINRLRLMSGDQVERLCFATLQGHARTVVRGRVLRRLVGWRVLAVLPRRVGGAMRGSAGAVYALGSAGARVLAERHISTTRHPRVRQPGVPTDRTLRHTLAVSELCVSLFQQAPSQAAQVLAFETEPAAWWPNGLGGYIKPDAYAALTREEVYEHWWIEVDLATESLPTIKHKLGAYLDFEQRRQLGPSEVVPHVLVTTVTGERCAAIQEVVMSLPDPARDLITVHVASDAPTHMLHSLRD